ncbi:hypothetical protein Acsp06_62910 [Actinomycetospora sp. NBRC 106375]|nr:hypothetical protein Acsp06_62910 [Actinomycetospora sp. NBRC 106375]
MTEVSSHRRTWSRRLPVRLGLAVAILVALGAGTASALTLTAEPVASPVTPVATPAPGLASPVLPPVVAPTPPPTTTTRTDTTTSRRATPTTRTHDRDEAGGSERNNTVSRYCSSNPDMCTDGVPDRRSDRAEYQDDPRSNAEINSGQPMHAPEGVCPGGYARVAGVC